MLGKCIVGTVQQRISTTTRTGNSRYSLQCSIVYRECISIPCTYKTANLRNLKLFYLVCFSYIDNFLSVHRIYCRKTFFTHCVHKFIIDEKLKKSIVQKTILLTIIISEVINTCVYFIVGVRSAILHTRKFIVNFSSLRCYNCGMKVINMVV